MRDRSVLGKYWSQQKYDPKEVEKLQHNLEISQFLATLLHLRKLDTLKAQEFLKPSLRNLLDPMHLLDMSKAVDRIISAIEKKEKICIFGDYDVDGATSSALLKRFFAEIGIAAEVYIPDRISEGYGISISTIKKLQSQRIKLVITVDCGSTAHEALEFANSNNLDVIVVDHHLGTEVLPKAIAIVNPNRRDETTEYKYLAAVGVAFLLIIALRAKLRSIGYFTHKEEPDLKNYLDLVALGTVCDVMLLTGLNRTLVVQGLKVISQGRNIGLQTIARLNNITSSISCYHLGYVIGPRINAGGRVGKADLGSKLLSAHCPNEANTIASELEIYNLTRKALEEQILVEASAIALEQAEDNVILVAGETWHPGVIGIIASRIKDQLHKPTIVISMEGDVGKASCRSIKGIDLGQKILDAKKNNLLIDGGGHAMAAGFTIQKDNLPKLKSFLEASIKPDLEKIQALDHWYSLELPVTGINQHTLEEISKLSPFGNGNPEPIFKVNNVKVSNVIPMKKGHLGFTITDWYTQSSNAIKAVAFYPPKILYEKITANFFNYPISLIGSIKSNEWKNRVQLQFIMQDIIN